MIKPQVTVRLDDAPSSAPSYAKTAPYHGEIWVSEGDLMDPVRGHEHCQLVLTEGITLQVRVNSFDRGGARAQVVGEGRALPPFS